MFRYFDTIDQFNRCIKIVLGEKNIEILRAEFQMITEINNINLCRNYIVGVIPESLEIIKTDTLCYGSFQMNIVGKPFQYVEELKEEDIYGMCYIHYQCYILIV